MIYVASYITANDYDCLVTDGDFREQTWEDCANGFTCCAGTDRDRVLAKAKAMLIEELTENYDDLDERTQAELADRYAMIENDLELIEDGKSGWYADVAGEHEAYIVIREFEEA